MAGEAAAAGPGPGQFAKINKKHVTRSRSRAGAEAPGCPSTLAGLPGQGDEGQRQDPSPAGHAPCKPRPAPSPRPGPRTGQRGGGAPARPGPPRGHIPAARLRIRSALQRRRPRLALPGLPSPPPRPLAAPPLPPPLRPPRSGARARPRPGPRLRPASRLPPAARAPEAAERRRGCLGNGGLGGPGGGAWRAGAGARGPPGRCRRCCLSVEESGSWDTTCLSSGCCFRAPGTARAFWAAGASGQPEGGKKQGRRELVAGFRPACLSPQLDLFLRGPSVARDPTPRCLFRRKSVTHKSTSSLHALQLQKKTSDQGQIGCCFQP